MAYILICNRSLARIWESNPRGDKFYEVAVLENPQGRLRNQDIDADRQGRNFESARFGVHSYQPKLSPTEEVATMFAGAVADELTTLYHWGRFRNLILVAEPRMLGLLRDKFSNSLAKVITKTIPKDLAGQEKPDIEMALRILLRKVAAPEVEVSASR